ncbi:MAG: hypothetical protein WEA77_12005 [Hyphomonas sp.]|uniref:hypothetical protein n=1 Tax=Hyphomonas sp. TaxID=87 RepID=UPI0034A0ABA0
MKAFNHKHAAAGCLALAVSLPVMADTRPTPPPEAARAVAGTPCTDMQVSVYCAAYETDLSPQSETLIKEAGKQLRACHVTDISIDDLPKEARTDKDAGVLSDARAETVISALLQNGIEPVNYRADYSRLEASAAGAAPMGEPMARRADVAFKV